MKEETLVIVNCPTCQKSITWDEKNLCRPFCSKRCQLIDLGEWANESHRIALEQTDEHDLWSEIDSLNNKDN